MKKQIKKVILFNMVISGIIVIGLGIVGSRLTYLGIMNNQVSKFAYGLTCSLIGSIVSLYFLYLNDLGK